MKYVYVIVAEHDGDAQWTALNEAIKAMKEDGGQVIRVSGHIGPDAEAVERIAVLSLRTKGGQE